jgi:hypothetical protein
MTHSLLISQLSVNAAIARIGDALHCQAGGTISLNAAMSAALAQATANVTLVENPTTSMRENALAMQTAMHDAHTQFLALADQDANAITEFVALRERGESLRGYELLCDGPRDMSDLAIVCTHHMQAFRAHVCERTRDDLEFAITLMTSCARAAMQLLDSNLRIWPLPELLQHYEPEVARLISTLSLLAPKERVR